jgi:hypothetical protein
VNPLSELETDAGDGLTSDLDSPMGWNGRLGEKGEPEVGIGCGVWVRKSVRQVMPDVPIVSDAQQ